MTNVAAPRNDLDLLMRTAEELLLVATDETRLLDTATELLGERYGYGTRYVLLHDDAANELYLGGAAGPIAETLGIREYRKPDRLGLSGKCWLSRRIVNVADVFAEPDYLRVLDSCHSEICVPVSAGDGMLGVLGVQSDHRGAFSEEDERLLAAFARLLAMGLVHARTHQARRKDIAELQAVSEVAERAAALDLRATLDTVCGSMRRLTTSDSVAVYLWDAHAEVLRMGALSYDTALYADSYERNLEASPLRLGEGMAGWAALHRRPVRIDDIAADPRPIAVRDTPMHAKSAIVIPLIVEERLVGVVRSVKMGIRSYNDDHFRFAQTLASQAALAIAAAEAHEEIRRLSVTDELTGAFNTRHGLQRLRAEIESALRHEDRVSLLVIDGDSMKEVNDRHGHAEGNHLLVQLTETMRGALRVSDVLARFGGDEFVVVLPRTGATDALVTAERLRTAVADQEFRTSRGAPLRATVSVGIATCPEDGTTADDLFREGDRRLYAAKAAGRNRVARAV